MRPTTAQMIKNHSYKIKSSIAPKSKRSYGPQLIKAGIKAMIKDKAQEHKSIRNKALNNFQKFLSRFLKLYGHVRMYMMFLSSRSQAYITVLYDKYG